MIRKRIRPDSVVYLGAVMEYLIAEVLELAGNCARDMKMKTIMPRHVMMAVEMDDELKHIFDDFKVIMPGVGVVPGIHPCLAARTVDQDTFKGWSRQNLSMKAYSCHSYCIKRYFRRESQERAMVPQFGAMAMILGNDTR